MNLWNCLPHKFTDKYPHILPGESSLSLMIEKTLPKLEILYFPSYPTISFQISSVISISDFVELHAACGGL